MLESELNSVSTFFSGGESHIQKKKNVGGESSLGSYLYLIARFNLVAHTTAVLFLNQGICQLESEVCIRVK